MTRNTMKRHFLLPLFLALTTPLLLAQKAPEKATGANYPAWEHEPVTLDGIDAAGVAALVKNPTKKLRLINVWATWCVPCVAEFPELVKLSREMKRDDFEVITISMDHPTKERAKALKFLEERRAGMSTQIAGTLKAEGRTSNNYIYTQLSQTPLIDALDSQWPGPIPHTILVAPGGEIVWRHNGEFDPVVLGRKIQETLGQQK
jgi:thiol-disulfide isomerase/thioredoxin